MFNNIINSDCFIITLITDSRAIHAQESAVRNGQHPRNDQGFAERIKHIQKASRAIAVTIAGYLICWGPTSIRLYLHIGNVLVPYWATMICFWFLLGSTMINIGTLSMLKSKYRLAFIESISKSIYLCNILSNQNRVGLHVDT